MKQTGLPSESPFAPVEPNRIVYEDDDAVAFYDGFPVSPGHTLVVAKQVTVSLFDLSEFAQAAVWRVVDNVRAILVERHGPQGFNIGLNDGPAAGQTVAHAHIHVIPRYNGDVPDPRGGIRWIFPAKARYWS
jgi:diadenosine tetraphosphate (Ap4A) HIT family hydrolase